MDLSMVPAGERALMATLAGRQYPTSGPTVTIAQHYPILPPPEADLPLALVFWEESVLPLAMVRQLDAYRGVLAPTRFVAKVLVDSGVAAPVRLLGHPPRLAPFLAAERPARLADGGVFRFLHVSSCFPRKGVDVLLAAYSEAFRQTDPVMLVIKGHPNPHNDVAAQIARLQAADPGLPDIQLIEEDLSEAALLDLYGSADAMVLPTRGEGFNLPAAEAMAAGLPLIVTGYGGHLDFCGPAEARMLDFSFSPAATHLSSAGSVWAEPRRSDVVAALREAVSAFGAARDRAARARLRIRQHITASVVPILEEVALDLLLAHPPEPVRVAWISPFQVRCGVAEYSRHMIGHLPQDGLAGVTVLADDRVPDAGSPGLAGTRVRRVWQVGDGASTQRLTAALAEEDPHLVVVQHQPGLMPWGVLAKMLRSALASGRAVAVTLHNTRHLGDIGADERRDALDALGRASRVLVHTVDDLNRLRLWGLLDTVALLPHGAPAPMAEPVPARPLGVSDAVTIGCYGFLLPGKGVPELIEAVALLRRTWPGARLLLVTAAYPGPDGEEELTKVRATIAHIGMGGAVTLITEFLPHDRSLALLAGCDVVVLPYRASLESSSAALRSVLAAGVPVAVTPLPLFDEANDAVVRMTGTDPAAISESLDRLLQDPARRNDASAAGRAWLLARSWNEVGRRMAGLIRSLSASAAASDA